MEHVVYVIGAGFSAPLGLPVMGDFLIKAKDLYAADTKRYAYFKRVFDDVRSMGGIQTYYEADLLNIEEILSILEMQDQIGGRRSKRFIKLLLDVVSHYTPEPPAMDATKFSANWYEYPIQTHAKWAQYFYFMMSLFNLAIGPEKSDVNRLYAQADQSAPARYSIVTLNYDTVFETWDQFLTSCIPGGANFWFDTGSKKALKVFERAVPLLKLHGSVATGEVIAPTWNKAISRRMSVSVAAGP